MRIVNDRSLKREDNMKTAVSVEGLVIPHVIKVGEVEKGFYIDDEKDAYSFLIRLSGTSIDRIFSPTKKRSRREKKEFDSRY